MVRIQIHAIQFTFIHVEVDIRMFEMRTTASYGFQQTENTYFELIREFHGSQTQRNSVSLISNYGFSLHAEERYFSYFSLQMDFKRARKSNYEIPR